MSIRCSGFASRSFIIGSRLCPPAMTRASGPSRCRDAIAPSTLVARSYSNDAGVCTRLLSSLGRAAGKSLARCADVFPLLVLDRRAGADHRGAGQGLGPRLAALGVQLPGGEAAALDVPERGTSRVPGCDRGLPAEPGEGERASRVHL